MIDIAMASPVPVPGTTCEMTGTPSATITATESTQDGDTTTGTPPIRPMANPRGDSRGRGAAVPDALDFTIKG